jgi:hypothetical protein
MFQLFRGLDTGEAATDDHDMRECVCGYWGIRTCGGAVNPGNHAFPPFRRPARQFHPAGRETFEADRKMQTALSAPSSYINCDKNH